MSKKKKEAPDAGAIPPAVPEVTAFKGFNHNLMCRDFQYEMGGHYTMPGTPVRCGSASYHAVRSPLDAWSYYAPIAVADGKIVRNRFGEVVMRGEIAEEPGTDTKIASVDISIRAEIKLPDYVKRAVSWVLNIAKVSDHPATTMGARAHSATTGARAHSATTGARAHSATTGAEAHSATTGVEAHSATMGARAHSATTGARAHSATTGARAHSATTGDWAHSATTGDWAHSATTGARAHSATTGARAHSATTGAEAHSATTGVEAHSATMGARAHSATTGARAHSATTGVEAHSATTGDWAIAASLGRDGVASAGANGWIVLAAYGQWDGEVYPLLMVKTAMVGGPEGIKAGVKYRLNDAGDFIEHQTGVLAATGNVE